MSADILRRAASLMRERAEGATDGPWSWQPTGDMSNSWALGTAWSDDDEPLSGRLEPGFEGEVIDFVCEHPAEGNPADAEHIASWHPAVALAVADWLDWVAEPIDALLLPPDAPLYVRALAVARAYLGETA